MSLECCLIISLSLRVSKTAGASKQLDGCLFMYFNMSTWHTWTGVGHSSGQLCGGRLCGGRLCGGWLCGGWLSGGRLSGGCWFGSWFVQLVDEASCTGYPMILQHLYTYT